MQRSKNRIGYPPDVDIALLPAMPVEGGQLTARLEGPFAQPAPLLTLQLEGNHLIASVYSEDFVYPNLPPVPAVQATIAAPPAGEYVLVVRGCGGNPPPPAPMCAIVSQQGFVVAEALSIPATSAWAAGALVLAAAALAAQRIERALTARERLRV